MDSQSRPLVIGLAIGLAGMALIVGSWLWPATSQTTTGWTPEKARERTNLGTELHALTLDKRTKELREKGEHVHDEDCGHGIGQCPIGRLEDVEKQWAKTDKEFRAPKAWGTFPATVMRWSGSILCIAGVGFFFFMKWKMDNDD